MKRFNVGIIGYGWAATAHIDAINATSLGQATAVCSSRDLDPNTLKATHGVAMKVYRSLPDMLEDPDIHAVSITSYPSSHAEQAIAVAKAGKHIILEKPVALSLQDLKRIDEAVTESGVQVCVCFEVRHSTHFLATKSILDQGLIGEVHYGEVDYYHGIGPWYGQFRWNTKRENGGSSLLSAGCHALDALLLCMPYDVLSVYSAATGSQNATFAEYEYPTTSVTIVNFANGRIGKVASVIDCLQPYYFHTHLVGSEGSMLDNRIYSSRIAGLKKEWSELNFDLVDSGDVSDHPYQTQFEAFFKALEAGQAMPLTSFKDAFRTFEVLFAADRSAEENRPVSLEEVRV